VEAERFSAIADSSVGALSEIFAALAVQAAEGGSGSVTRPEMHIVHLLKES
jgi:hypothetical protein